MKLAMAVLSLLVSVSIARCAEMPKYSTTVQIRLTAGEDDDGKVLQNNAISYLSREIRALGDVRVTDTRPEWEMALIILRPKVNGTEVGYSISYVLTRHSYPDYLVDHISKQNPKLRPVLNIYLKDVCTIEDHQLSIVPNDGLEAACKELVAGFDTEHIAPQRKFWDDMRAKQ